MIPAVTFVQGPIGRTDVPEAGSQTNQTSATGSSSSTAVKFAARGNPKVLGRPNSAAEQAAGRSTEAYMHYHHHRQGAERWLRLRSALATNDWRYQRGGMALCAQPWFDKCVQQLDADRGHCRSQPGHCELVHSRQQSRFKPAGPAEAPVLLASSLPRATPPRRPAPPAAVTKQTITCRTPPRPPHLRRPREPSR